MQSKKSAEPKPLAEPRPALPVVAIGASAGGLEALKHFFEAMPMASGMAFVVIQHLDPDKPSRLAEILARSTAMAVSQAAHLEPLRPNQVYVAPPGKGLSLADGRLRLTDLPKDRLLACHSVDAFLRSLAAAQGELAIAVLLSGAGDDGAAGLMAVRAAGGLVLVQEPKEAAYDGMPSAAIHTGLVDGVLPVGRMAAELQAYVREVLDAGDERAPTQAEEQERQVTAILDLLARRRAADFSGYKRGTLIRRIERRMKPLHLADLAAYGERLREDEAELGALAKDLLIVVTAFFRDPEAFAQLQAKVIVPLCQRAVPESPIRVWVAGAASGEEAYSIAILILEELARLDKGNCGVQVFATDLDKNVLLHARKGLYPESIAADVSPERLARFFDKQAGGGYQVKKAVRELITFAEHDLVKDTPFSRLDLISCRNLLIYLGTETQRHILTLFHFALRPSGVLYLGSTETVGQADRLFLALDKKWRIYRKIDSVRMPVRTLPRPRQLGGAMPVAGRDQGISLRALGERQLLQYFSPCGVLLNQALEVVQFLGNTSLFLSLPEGSPTTSLLAMVPAAIRTPLRAMLQDVIARRPGPSALLFRLPDQEGRPYRQVQIGVRRIEAQDLDQELLVVAFFDLPVECEALTPDQAQQQTAERGDHELIIRQLEDELLMTRESLETTIEQLESANEELRSCNEATMSLNEELMSTNEELETSKEELQSANEELTSTNIELQERLTELESTNNDLDNLLASSEVGFLFLDDQFRIKRFTAAIQRLFRLIPADLGRPLADFGMSFSGFSLLDLAARVLGELAPIEREVQTADGRWLLLRLLPYRTRGNQIQGVLIAILDISGLKDQDQEFGRQAALLKNLYDALPWRVAYLDTEGRHLFANQAYLRGLDLQPGQEVRGLTLGEVLGPAFQKAAAPFVKQALAGMNASFEKNFDFPGLGRRDILCSLSPNFTDQGQVVGFFVMLRDVTERRAAEATRAWLSAIVESSHDAIISRGFDGTIRSWNQGAERLFGYRADEMLGKTICRLFVVEQEGGGLTDVELLCRGAGSGQFEPYCLTKDDRRLAVLLTQSPILGQDGEPVAVSVVMSDISARREMEHQLAEINRNLEKKVAERTLSLQQHMAQLRRLALELTQTEERERQRLATVLHNDLQQLLVAAGLRLERLANTEDDRGRLQGIQAVEGLISQSVAATRSLATDLRPPVLSSGNLVKSLHWLADWLWKRFDFTLKLVVPDDDLRTDAIPDEDLVFLFNTAREMCFNIVKHAHVKEGRMTLLRTAEDRLRITFADDGVGVDLSRPDLANAADGGMGLGVIRDRLALIGGELHIDSAVGQGFRAEITLPYALTLTARARREEAIAAKAPERRRQAAASDRKIRIMLVDDHAVVRDGLKMILSDETDMDVIGEAGDGEKALKMAGKLRPDVIIMDVNMPKMDGIEATRLIKEAYPEIAVIALSINDDAGTNTAMLEAGAYAYLNKSGSADDVCGVIRSCLQGETAEE